MKSKELKCTVVGMCVGGRLFTSWPRMKKKEEETRDPTFPFKGLPPMT
jgi:hypothetical protein